MANQSLGLEERQTDKYQIKGPARFFYLRERLSSENLTIPTAAQIFSILYGDKKISNEYQYNNPTPLWLNNSFVYSSKGIYVEDNPEESEGQILADEKSLEARLGSKEQEKVIYSEDNTIRFTPFGFKIGSLTAEELAKNTCAIALMGKANTEKLSEALGRESINPFLFTLDYSNIQASQGRTHKRIVLLNYSPRNAFFIDGADRTGNGKAYYLPISKDF